MSKLKPAPSEAEERQRRLASALRDNLKRRKAQARKRAEPAPEPADSGAKPDNPPPKG